MGSQSFILLQLPVHMDRSHVNKEKMQETSSKNTPCGLTFVLYVIMDFFISLEHTIICDGLRRTVRLYSCCLHASI